MAAMITLPEFPVHGGCQCGAVRYKLLAVPVVFYICHCTECQKQSASAFGESVRVRQDALDIAGHVETFTSPGNGKASAERDFCGTCGTRLFHRRAQYHEFLNIKGGTLDDKSWLIPAGHIWTRSRQKWVTIPDDALAYEEQPDNYQRLTDRWRVMTGMAV